MLTVRDLRRAGLGPVSFGIAAGECVALMGPSGAGKTLLLRAIADLDPNEGEVALDGVRREAVPAPRWRRMVTYLAAEAGWWADRVAAHFEDPAAAVPLVRAMGLEAAALEWPVERLSTGERQRLALARVLVREPRAMLLDEPTSGLDRAAAEAVEGLLRRRLAAGAAILLVTHDPGQARRLARRRLAIAAGRLVEERFGEEEARGEGAGGSGAAP